MYVARVQPDPVIYAYAAGKIGGREKEREEVWRDAA